MADSSHPIRTRSTWIYAGLVFAAAIITDQASKLWARTALDGSDTIPVIGQWLSLRLVHNSGAAFSFAAGKTWILTIFTVVIIGVLAVLARRVHRASTLLAIALLAGGAVGNLIDRLTAEPASASATSPTSSPTAPGSSATSPISGSSWERRCSRSRSRENPRRRSRSELTHAARARCAGG